MLSSEQAEGRAAALVEAALKAGADAADVLYIGDASTSVQVRLGELEEVGRPRARRSACGCSSVSDRRVSSSDLSAERCRPWSNGIGHGRGGARG